MRLEYIAPELEIKHIKLTNVILNSLDETIKPTGNIEEPDDPADPW